MSKDTAVAWAKKMADVLGDAATRAKEAVGGSPTPKPAAGTDGEAKPPGGGGTPAGGGSPSGGAVPSGGGAPTAGDAPAAAPTGGGAAPAASGPSDGKGDGGKPAPGASPVQPAGSGAKGHAEAAKKALSDISPLVTQAQSAEGEAKKLTSDAQAGKKQIDEAKRQAEAAEKGIPAAAPVPVPQGKDPKAQYDSAIQITGNMRKVQNDAEAKESTVREQGGVADEGNANVELAKQNAKKSADKLKQLADQAASLVESAAGSANSAATAAAEAKKKADQAAKDKAADKDTLQKAADEDAKHASAAKDAAAKAQAASKQLATSAKNAETQSQSIEKLKQEAKTVVEAVKQKANGLPTKLQPHFEAVAKAEQQEAEYKAKLSEEDAEAVLKKRYEELGGDPELTKALADEDKEYETRVEKFRASQKEWQKDKIKELDEYKSRLESTLKYGDEILPALKGFYEREQPIAEQVAADAKSLDKKLATEPGKELTHVIDQHKNSIATVKRKVDFNEKVIEKTKAAMEVLKQRYEDVNKQYEASEKLIKETRTELDNILEMENMTLDLKVDFLQTRPKPVRDRIQKQLDDELNRILRISILETKTEQVEFEPPSEPVKRDPIDWAPVKEKIAKLQKTSLEELQKDDPKLADIQAEYDKAGGDPALLEKRLATWKKDVEFVEEANKGRADDYKTRSEKLRQQHSAADANAKESQANYTGFEALLAQKRARFEELKKKADPMNYFKDFTPQEKAEYQLLEREIKRLETQVKNLDAERIASKSAKESAEKLVEQERQRHEQIMDKGRVSLPKPKSEDIHKMPLKAKYTELTGKPAPA